MNRLQHTSKNRAQRQHRTRATLTGSAERPRLSVHVSNRHITAQIIDDQAGHTLAYVTTVGAKHTGTLIERADKLGTDIATKAKSAKVSKVVFDRGSKLYHGRVAALADAARKAGLEF